MCLTYSLTIFEILSTGLLNKGVKVFWEISQISEDLEKTNVKI